MTENQYELEAGNVRLRINAVLKENRYLTTASVSIVGSKIGVSIAKDVSVEYRQLRDNVYEITITGPAGEYCIMPVLNGTAGYAGVFDFALE